METREYIGVILGLYENNGKENGNYYIYRVEDLGFKIPKFHEALYCMTSSLPMLPLPQYVLDNTKLSPVWGPF